MRTLAASGIGAIVVLTTIIAAYIFVEAIINRTRRRRTGPLTATVRRAESGDSAEGRHVLSASMLVVPAVVTLMVMTVFATVYSKVQDATPSETPSPSPSATKPSAGPTGSKISDSLPISIGANPDSQFKSIYRFGPIPFDHYTSDWKSGYFNVSNTQHIFGLGTTSVCTPKSIPTEIRYPVNSYPFPGTKVIRFYVGLGNASKVHNVTVIGTADNYSGKKQSFKVHYGQIVPVSVNVSGSQSLKITFEVDPTGPKCSKGQVTLVYFDDAAYGDG